MREAVSGWSNPRLEYRLKPLDGCENQSWLSPAASGQVHASDRVVNVSRRERMVILTARAKPPDRPCIIQPLAAWGNLCKVLPVPVEQFYAVWVAKATEVIFLLLRFARLSGKALSYATWHSVCLRSRRESIVADPRDIGGRSGEKSSGSGGAGRDTVRIS